MADTSTHTSYGHPIILTEGPFAGWMTWGGGQDPFETLLGPFCYKVEEDGRIRAAFQPQRHHLNGGNALHGGALMSFADFALFAIAHHSLIPAGQHAVTLSFNSEFLSAGGIDAPVEAVGEVMKETGSVIFVQGRLVQAGRPLLAFSGVLKKIKPKA